jgi:hypothetical protein
MLSRQLHPQHSAQAILWIHRNDFSDRLDAISAIEAAASSESPIVDMQMEKLHDRVDKFEHIQHLREMQNDNFAVRAIKRLTHSAA